MQPFESIIEFWFKEITPSQWWEKDEAFDALIRERFNALHQRAITGELADWRNNATGRLAEIIVLDQFSRNLYRDQAKAFANDGMALALAQEGIRVGADIELEKQQRVFFYLPFMHSESAQIHQQAVLLFKELGMEDNLKYEYKHKEIIDRFGRYPHRNAILGRTSTAEEIAFLATPGSSF